MDLIMRSSGKSFSEKEAQSLLASPDEDMENAPLDDDEEYVPDNGPPIVIAKDSMVAHLRYVTVFTILCFSLTQLSTLDQRNFSTRMLSVPEIYSTSGSKPQSLQRMAKQQGPINSVELSDGMKAFLAKSIESKHVRGVTSTMEQAMLRNAEREPHEQEQDRIEVQTLVFDKVLDEDKQDANDAATSGVNGNGGATRAAFLMALAACFSALLLV